MTASKRVIIIGAGAGGLAAAMDLSAAGSEVTVIDRAAAAGGKMRQVEADGAKINAGPTVFTMRWIFESLFERSNADFATELTLAPAENLARHGWLDGSTLDLWADVERSAEAIGTFSDTHNANGYLKFCSDSKSVFETLKETFINAQKPSPIGLGLRVGLHRVNKLWETRPMQSYWSKLERYFSDPRLQQLFGRYSTYVGSSPYLTPATLMLIAHVEQDGVWLVDGGMHAVARAMQRAAERNGATIRFGETVQSITVKNGAARGVTLGSGEYLESDAVVFNGDSAALAAGKLGEGADSATRPTPPKKRSRGAIHGPKSRDKSKNPVASSVVA